MTRQKGTKSLYLLKCLYMLALISTVTNGKYKIFIALVYTFQSTSRSVERRGSQLLWIAPVLTVVGLELRILIIKQRVLQRRTLELITE